MVFRKTGIAAIIAVLFLMVSCSTLPVAGGNDQPEGEPEKGPEAAEPELTEGESEISFDTYEQLTVTQGEHKDKIVISWENETEQDSVVLLKSLKDEDPYTVVTRLNGLTSYEDKDIERGMKIYYRLVRLEDGEAEEGSVEEGEEVAGDNSGSSDTAQGDFELDDTVKELEEKYAAALLPEKKDSKHENYGYASVTRPASKNLDALMGSYKKGESGPVTENEKKYYKEHMAYLKEKYEHPVKLNMVLTVTRPYINSGKLEVHTGFTSFTHVRSLRSVYIFNKDHSAVYMFNNNITSGSLRKENRKGLFNRLILNSVAFCGYTGEKQVKDEKGYTRIVPGFDVVALAAYYSPQNRNWKNKTYLIVTSNKKLRREIQKARSN